MQNKRITRKKKHKNCTESSSSATSNSTSVMQTSVCSSQSNTVFNIGELVWGPVRGYMAWPGKIVSQPNDVSHTNDSTTCWVRWFGSKPNVELVQCSSLKSLSEGLEAHHKAQRDNRK